MKSIHLSDTEIYSMIIEPDAVDENLQLHLKKCQECQKRLEKMQTFLQAYQEEIDYAEINWIQEKGKILSAVSDYQAPALRLRWRTAVILAFIVVASAVLFEKIYFQPNNSSMIEETELQEEMWFFPESSIGEAELPQNIALLNEWDEEDFRQFLNFFLPIEEYHNEKNNSTTDSLRIYWFDQPVFA
jgi:hypothetical protein